MENRLKIQDIQGDELYMDLTPEELEELEQLKGGGLALYSGYSIYKPFPLGFPNPYPYINIKGLGGGVKF